MASKRQEFDYQFVWTVSSAFPKGTMSFTTDNPFADGNSRIWKGEPEKQLQQSLFEIVCRASSATLFIGLTDELGKRLVANAAGIEDLDKENRLRYAAGVL